MTEYMKEFTGKELAKYNGRNKNPKPIVRTPTKILVPANCFLRKISKEQL
jgi:hypothetical protein